MNNIDSQISEYKQETARWEQAIEESNGDTKLRAQVNKNKFLALFFQAKLTQSQRIEENSSSELKDLKCRFSQKSKQIERMEERQLRFQETLDRKTEELAEHQGELAQLKQWNKELERQKGQEHQQKLVIQQKQAVLKEKYQKLEGLFDTEMGRIEKFRHEAAVEKRLLDEERNSVSERLAIQESETKREKMRNKTFEKKLSRFLEKNGRYFENAERSSGKDDSQPWIDIS